MIKYKLLLSVLACLLLLATMVCGCSGSANQAEVDSIEVRLRTVKSNTGLEILLIPRDSEGFLVETDGSLDANLWLQEGLATGEVPHLYLIQGWNDVQISSNDYTQFQGASIDLMYDEEKSYIDIYGSLEVTLVTPDGKSLTCTLSNIAISENYNC